MEEGKAAVIGVDCTVGQLAQLAGERCGDTKTGPLSLSLHERAETWKEAYEALKKEVKAENISVPAFSGNTGKKPPYFFTGMQENERTKQG